MEHYEHEFTGHIGYNSHFVNSGLKKVRPHLVSYGELLTHAHKYSTIIN